MDPRKKIFPTYESRAVIVDKIKQQMQSDWLGAMAQVQEYAQYESEDLKRDVCAMLWEQRLFRSETVERRQLTAALLNAAVQDTPFIQGQALKFLLDFRAEDFTDDALHIIESLNWRGPYADLQIRLAGVAQVKNLIGKLREKVGVTWKHIGQKRYQSQQWAAALALARMGESGYVDLVVQTVKNETDAELRCGLFADLAFTRQQQAFNTLRHFLRSDFRLPATNDFMKSPTESWFAAVTIAKHVADFPIKSWEIDEAALPNVRKWAGQVDQWLIKDI